MLLQFVILIHLYACVNELEKEIKIFYEKKHKQNPNETINFRRLVLIIMHI
jgi:hypothetical protein